MFLVERAICRLFAAPLRYGTFPLVEKNLIRFVRNEEFYFSREEKLFFKSSNRMYMQKRGKRRVVARRSRRNVIRPSKGDVFFKVQLRLVPYIRIEITFMFLFRRLRKGNHRFRLPPVDGVLDESRRSHFSLTTTGRRLSHVASR